MEYTSLASSLFMGAILVALLFWFMSSDDDDKWKW
jgi:hypothetical protein